MVSERIFYSEAVSVSHKAMLLGNDNVVTITALFIVLFQADCINNPEITDK